MDERTFVDAHGVSIFSRWWLTDAPRGVVVISHGASEHSGRYDRFARALNAAGFAAVALDHRGHGHTRATTGIGIMGPGGGQAVVDDLHELRTTAEWALGPDVPTFFFGHSLGSIIGVAYLAQHAEGLAGAVLCGMAADLEGVAALGEALQGFADAGMRDEPASDLLAGYNATFEPARTKFDWLSRDPAEVDKYIADPFCGDDNPLTFGYLLDVFNVVAPAGEHLADVSCPVFVIAGDHDAAAAMGANATALAEALGAAGVPVEAKLYPDARHELLNETNRDDVTADLIAWLRRRM
jgi:alpha-beta hydrolase superfamily lysophospholipase